MLDDPRLLVVDDEDVVCQGCRRIFSPRGFQVETSTDSREGLDLARANDYAAVLLDIKMPVMDGLQFLERLRREKPDLPVIFITGFPCVPTAASAVRLGATDYVTKPFTPDEITRTVEETLRSREPSTGHDEDVKDQGRRNLILASADRVSAHTEAKQLRSLGCEVRVVSGWAELQPALGDPEYNVLVLDASSFGPEGPGLVGRVNSESPSTRTVVIAPSASQWESAYREQSIFYYAVEPFVDNEIVEILDAVFHPRPKPLPHAPAAGVVSESTGVTNSEQEAQVMLDAIVACNRGLAHERSGQLDRAVAFFSEAIRLNPRFSRAYEGRALVRRDAGNLQGALADYTEAIRLNPNDAEAYAGRGIGYLADGGYTRESGYLSVRRQRCFDKAIDDFASAIRIEPQNPELYFWRGTGYRVKGDAEKAVANFAEAIRLKADHAKSYLGRARVLEQLGETEKAQDDYRKAEQLNPHEQITRRGT